MNFSLNKLSVLFFLFTVILFAQIDKSEPSLNSNQKFTAPEVVVEPFIVNGALDSSQSQPNILAETNGNFYVTWVDSRNGYDEIFATKFSTQGTRIGDEKVISVADDSRKWGPKVYADPQSENKAITWSDYPIEENWGYNVKNRTIANNFDYASDVITATDWLMYSICFPEILFIDNNIYTIWRVTEDYSVKELYIQNYTRTWEAIGSNTNIPIRTPLFHDTEGIGFGVTQDNNLLVAWSHRADDYDLKDSINARLFNLDGNPISEKFTVYEPEGIIVIDLIEIESISENKFLFVWDERFLEDDGSLYGELGPRQIRARIVENEEATHELVIQEPEESISYYYDKDKNFSVIPFGNNFIITWETSTQAKGILVDDELNILNEYLFFEKPANANARKFNYSLSDSLLYLTWESDIENNTDWDVWASVLKLDAPNDVKTDETIIKSYSLSQNYPNPFNPSTTIKFAIPNLPSPYQGEGSRVRLVVYDILGREIKTLLNKPMQHGECEVEFDGSDLPSGVYFYRLSAGKFSQTRKMVLIK